MMHYMKTIMALLTVFAFASCASTKIKLVSDSSGPWEEAVLDWQDGGVVFPLMIGGVIRLPEVGTSLRANEAIRDLKILNSRADDVQYPKSIQRSALPSRRELSGSVNRPSKDELVLDVYFTDSQGRPKRYPFSGRHRMETRTVKKPGE